MSKRKPKVEAPKEAWAVVSPQNSAVINFARTMVPEGFAEVRYVPADPRRDAVVKAAVAEREAYLRYICDDSDADDLRRLGKAQEKTAARVDAYTAAVEKMRRGGK